LKRFAPITAIYPRRRLPRASDGGVDVFDLDRALNEPGFRPLPEALERRYQEDTAEPQTRALFRAALGAAAFYNVQLLAEWSLTPDVFSLAAALHFGVVTPALLTIAAFARSARTPDIRDLMGFAIPALVAMQAALVYFASEADESGRYLSLLAVIGVLANVSLPLSSRAALSSASLCLGMVGLLSHAWRGGVAAPLEAVGLLPIELCVVMTLYSAFQRNREARRVYLLDLRHRLRLDEVGREARHDPLTGLANRRRLEEAAKKLWAEESQLVSPMSIVIYDVDRFKAFNDLYGHIAGDKTLRRIAACALQEIGGEDDVAARYGGEEFILLLPRTPLDEARRVAERLRAAVAALRIPHAGAEELGVVTASFGVATADCAHCRFDELTAEADAALYLAKRSGRNRVLAAVLGAAKDAKVA
jgi:diguanylate cyclase (GGDEF)-like protein